MMSILEMDLLQPNEQIHIQYAHDFRQHEAHHVQQKALTVGEREQRWLQWGFGSHLGADLRLEYGDVHDEADQHY